MGNSCGVGKEKENGKQDSVFLMLETDYIILKTSLNYDIG